MERISLPPLRPIPHDHLNPAIEKLSTTLDDPAEQDISHVNALHPYWYNCLNHRTDASYRYCLSSSHPSKEVLLSSIINYYFKSIQNTSMQSRIAKVLKHSFSFLPIKNRVW